MIPSMRNQCTSRVEMEKAEAEERVARRALRWADAEDDDEFDF